MTAAAALLAGITFVLKGAAVLAPRLPPGVERRLAGLAPALLAALVVTELTSRSGVPRLDAKTAGVGVAVALAAVRAPLLACVVGGAATAAVLRAFG